MCPEKTAAGGRPGGRPAGGQAGRRVTDHLLVSSIRNVRNVSIGLQRLRNVRLRPDGTITANKGPPIEDCFEGTNNISSGEKSQPIPCSMLGKHCGFQRYRSVCISTMKSHLDEIRIRRDSSSLGSKVLTTSLAQSRSARKSTTASQENEPKEETLYGSAALRTVGVRAEQVSDGSSLAKKALPSDPTRVASANINSP